MWGDMDLGKEKKRYLQETATCLSMSILAAIMQNNSESIWMIFKEEGKNWFFLRVLIGATEHQKRPGKR